MTRRRPLEWYDTGTGLLPDCVAMAEGRPPASSLRSRHGWRPGWLATVLLGPAFWFSAAMVVYRSGWLTGWRVRSDDKTEVHHGSV